MKKILAFTTTAVMLPVTLMAGWGGGCLYEGFGFGGHHGYWGGSIMFIISAILLALVVFFGVKYFKGNEVFKKEDPLEILKSRYARGEITKDEFEDMKNTIK